MLKIEQKENRKVNREENRKRKRDEKKLSPLPVILTGTSLGVVKLITKLILLD